MNPLQALTDIAVAHVNVHLPTDYMVRLWQAEQLRHVYLSLLGV